MTTSVAIFPLLGCSILLAIVAVIFAAPTTYDQRQDGNLNLAAKFENILVVVAIPSKKPSNPSYSDALEAYLAQAMNNRKNVGPQVEEEGNPPSAEIESSSDEVEADVENPAPSSPNEEDAVEDGSGLSQPSRSARSLPAAPLDYGSPKGLFDNELPTDHNQQKIKHDEQNNADIESLKLIGDGIENCGPERRRDSYGICQWSNV